MANQPAYKIPGQDNRAKATGGQTTMGGMGGMGGYKQPIPAAPKAAGPTRPYVLDMLGASAQPGGDVRGAGPGGDVRGAGPGGSPTTPYRPRETPSPGLGAVVGGDAFTPGYTEQAPGEFDTGVAQQNFDQFMQNLQSLMGNLSSSQANYEQMKQEALGNLEYQYGNQLAALSDMMAASGMGQSGMALTGATGLGAQSLGAMNQAMTGIQQQQYDDLLKRTQMEGDLSLGALNALLGNVQTMDAAKTAELERALNPLISFFNMALSSAESGESFGNQVQAQAILADALFGGVTPKYYPQSYATAAQELLSGNGQGETVYGGEDPYGTGGIA